MARYRLPCCLGVALAAVADAAPIPVFNSSFETPAVSAGNFNVASAPTGWVAVGTIEANWRSVGVVNPNTTTLYLDPVPNGTNVGVVFLGPTFSNIPSGLRQTLTNPLQSRTVYTLTVEVGNIGNDPIPPHNQFDFAGFPGYRIDLLAGTNVVASDHNSLLPGEGRFLTSTVTLATASSHTNLGQALGIRLINLDSAPGLEVNFDNVRLDAAPRPDPVIALAPATNGALSIDFTELLGTSDDLQTWTLLDPQPASPCVITPTNTTRYFRASD